MDEQGTERTVSLAELWGTFKSHIIPILLAVLLCDGLLFGYSELISEPKYNSTATLYVLRQDRADGYMYTESDFTLALDVVNDCTYMLKSRAVLNEVIDKLSLGMSFDELCEAVSVSNPDNTRILEVSVRTDSAAVSKRIVDCVCRIGADKIGEAMGTEQVYLYSEGTLEDEPCNTVGLSVFAAVGIGAAVVMYAICLTAYILNDKKEK